MRHEAHGHRPPRLAIPSNAAARVFAFTFANGTCADVDRQFRGGVGGIFFAGGVVFFEICLNAATARRKMGVRIGTARLSSELEPLPVLSGDNCMCSMAEKKPVQPIFSVRQLRALRGNRRRRCGGTIWMLMKQKLDQKGHHTSTHNCTYEISLCRPTRMET